MRVLGMRVNRMVMVVIMVMIVVMMMVIMLGFQAAQACAKRLTVRAIRHV